MIKLEEALELIGDHLLKPVSEIVPLAESLGRTLAAEVLADRDMPPFNRASMDGYACRRNDLKVPLRILETIPAGKFPSFPLGTGECSRIMTGAMVPEGADCVIMQEHTRNAGDDRIIFTGHTTDGNISLKGEDLKEADLLLPGGTRIRPRHLGILAAAGYTEVEVIKKFTVGILATGSELVDVSQEPDMGRIRNSNSWQIMGKVIEAGHLPVLLGIVEDESSTLERRMQESFSQCDLLLVTGGASVGEFDLVPGVLDKTGFSILFDRVAIQPGKPVTFAHKDGKVCFGLSGNPVSCFVQFELLVRPYLSSSSGSPNNAKRIRCKFDRDFIRQRTDRLLYLPVVLTEPGYCTPLDYHGSAHLHALNHAAGFAEIAEGKAKMNRGEEADVRLI